MSDTLNKVAQQFVEGEWLFDSKDKILKKQFASKNELVQLNLIDDEGYLNPELKALILEILGKSITQHAIGPFGDNDIFSGDLIENGILYNLEFHQVSEDILQAVKSIGNVTIKKS